MKRKSYQGLASALSLGAFAVIVISGPGHAATLTKADNTITLDQGGSWGGTAPGAADLANWSGTYTTAGSLGAALPGSALAWNGISIGAIGGTAAGTVAVGGTGAAVVGSRLTIGAAGINMAGANQDLVLNAETLNLNTSQTWTIPSGRDLRLGSGAMTAKVAGTGGSATVIGLAGGGVVDANQSATNGFADFTGKWVVNAGTTLRGVQSGTAAWGSNPDADAIQLKGGTLAVGGITGAAGNWTWPVSIQLGAGTTSFISGRNSDTSTRTLALQGGLSGDGNLVFEKLSGGTLRISVERADNPLTGNVTINGTGVSNNNLAVQPSVGTTAGFKTPLGTGDITVNGGATLEFLTPAATAAAVTIPNNLNLNGSILRCRDAFQTYTGTIAVAGSSSIEGMVDGKDTTLDGLIQDGATPGSLTIKSIASQRMILPNPNYHTGGTTLGTNTANAGIVVLGSAEALGTGTVTLRGAQLWADVPDMIVANPLELSGGTSTSTPSGGLCVGGVNNLAFSSTAVLDNFPRIFQNSGTGTVTLGAIDLSAGTTARASFGLNTAKGAFDVTGAIYGAGRVEIKGGTVTLAGANTYTGTTTVSSFGILNLTGSLTSDVTLSGSATAIMGNGSTTGSFTTSGATSGTILLDPANPTSGLTAGAVSFNGTTKVDLLGQQGLGTTVYTVINYATLAGLVNLTSTNQRVVFADDPVGKKVTMAVTAANRTWNHAVSTTWNQTDKNWVEGDQLYFSGDAVTFGDAAGVVTIGGVLTPSMVTFNNSAGNDCTLTASAGNYLAGPGGMTKSGAGRVLLLGENQHSGRTTISGGTLAIQAGNCLGSVPATPVADQLVFDGGTLKLEPVVPSAMTLQANRGITLGGGGGVIDSTAVGDSATATIGGLITGSGPLTLRANGDTSDTGGGVPGAMLLSGYNDFVGPVTITSGVVSMASYFGDWNNPVTLDGGGIVDQNQNLTFSNPLEIGAAGGVLRSYGNANTSLSGGIANAPGVATATVRHTDGGVQNISGDGSGFTGTFINARGITNFDSEAWQGMDLVNVDGAEVRFRSYVVTQVKSVTTDRDLHIELDTTLDVVSGNFTVAPGAASQNFWVQNEGNLTSSSGTLTFDFQTPYTAVGADDQAVRVLIVDPDSSSLKVVKNGPGGINTYDRDNTYTGGTIVNQGRISVANPYALGYGPVTVNPGGQLFLTVNNGFYSNDMTIAGAGPAEPAGNLGAIRFQNNSVTGNLTIGPAGARVVAYQGSGTIEGFVDGTGNLELNSPAAGHNGAISLLADGLSYTGKVTLAQGILTLGGSLGGDLTCADGTTLMGEGEVGGTLTMGTTTGATLRVNGTSPEALTVGRLAHGGPYQVQLDSLPDPVVAVPVVNYTTMEGTVADFESAPSSLYRLVFADTGTSITAEVVTAARTWAGTVNGSWDSATKNWVEGDQRFFAGDTVLLDDTATTKVLTIAAPVSPASVRFNNSTGNDYAVTGRMITPVGGNLVKDGAGTVTLSGDWSNIGGSVVLNGGRTIAANTDYGRVFGTTTRITVNASAILQFRGTNLLYDGAGSTPVTINAGGKVELNAYHNHFRELVLNGGTITGIRSDADGRYADEYSTFDSPVTVGGTQMSRITAAGSGGYSINGAPFNVADATAGTDLLISARLVGGALLKTGNGTLELTAFNTYTGMTTVEAGELKGDGSVRGGLTVGAAGTIAPGSGVGAFTVTGTTTLNGTYACEVSGATADRLSVVGNLTIAASGAKLAFTTLAAPSTASYVIASYTGTFTGSIASLTVTGLPSGYTLSHDTTAKQIKLTGSSTAGYSSWAATQAPGQTPAQDYDGDGVSNGLEWVLGGTKNTNDLGKLPVASAAGGDLVFTFKRAQASKSADTAVAIQVGTTLAAWPSLYNVGATTGTSSPGVTVIDNGNGTDTITLRVTRAPDKAKFGRLRVTIN